MSTSTPELTPAQLFQLIKEFEAEIPIPAPFVTIDVGTFDVTTGKFTGLTTQVYTDPEPLQHEPGQRPTNPPPRFEGAEYVTFSTNAEWRETVTREPAPVVPVAPVLLQFNVTSAPSPWSVTVAGYTSTAAAGQTSISVDIWDLTAVGWALEIGGGGHSDRLIIQRNAALPAAGGFTIPVLPVAIIYAPPADSEKKSTATYAQGNTVGTSVSYDFSTDSSQTVEPVFADGAAFRAFLGVVSTALSVAGGALTDAGDKTAGGGDSSASKDITGLLSLLPSDTMTEQQGVSTDSSSTLTLTYTTTSTIGTTAAGGGPGVGDTVVFFKDTLVAWAYNEGSLQLCPMGWTEVVVTASQIQNNPAQVGIATSDQQLLLSLDPFVAGGLFAAVPPGRFVVPAGAQASIEYGGGATWSQSYAVTRDDKELSSEKSYTTDTNTWNPGEVLEMFGFGTTKSQMTTTIGTATGSDVSQTVTLAVNLVSGPTDNFTLAIWYDTLFGTWAFQQLEPVSQPVVSGQGAEPGEVVTLESAGRVHATVANAQGHYAFRAPNIAPGRAQLFIGKKPPTTVTISEAAHG